LSWPRFGWCGTLACSAQTAAGAEKQAIGGVTFRMYRAGNDALILDVLTLAMKQQRGICGNGYGTRMVNFLKMYALSVD